MSNLKSLYVEAKCRAKRQKALKKTNPANKTSIQTLLHYLSAILESLAIEMGHQSWAACYLKEIILANDEDVIRRHLAASLHRGQHWKSELLLRQYPLMRKLEPDIALASLNSSFIRDAMSRDKKFASRLIGLKSPLHHLAGSRYWRLKPKLVDDQLKIAKILIEGGADVNAGYPVEPGSDNLLSVLYEAIGHSGNLDLARLLLEQGADPNDGESLYHSCEIGHREGVRLLLRHGAQPKGTNALLRALDFDDEEMVALLLAHGADPNENADVDEGQQLIPALHHAIKRNCSLPLIRLLLDHGADPDNLYLGHKAFGFAAIFGHTQAMQHFQNQDVDHDLSKLEQKFYGIARDQAGITLQKDELSSETAFLIHHLISSRGSVQHVERLIKAGLDPNQTDMMGLPPVHTAGWLGRQDMVACLLNHTPDLQHRNGFGGDLLSTIIHGDEFSPEGSNRDHLACAALALEAGAQIEKDEIDFCGNPEMISLLCAFIALNTGS